MNIVGSHFIPSEHPYQIIFDRDSCRLGMQIGTLIVLENSSDSESSQKRLCRSMPVVSCACKKVITRNPKSFMYDMNMPIDIREAEVWENCRVPIRVCIEDDKCISLKKFSYFLQTILPRKDKDTLYYFTPSSFQRSLDNFGVNVNWPKNKRHKITLVRAQLHKTEDVVLHWCQSKVEDGFFFFAFEENENDMCWSIVHQAYFYYTQNNEYFFIFDTDVPDYKGLVDNVNSMVNNYCRRPK